MNPAVETSRGRRRWPGALAAAALFATVLSAVAAPAQAQEVGGDPADLGGADLGLEGGDTLGGDPLGPSTPENPGESEGLSAADLLDADGAWTWSDGDRDIKVFPLPGAAAGETPDGAATQGSPGPDGIATNSTRGTVFTTDTGQLLHLQDGVVAFVSPDLSAAETAALFARHGVAADQRLRLAGTSNGWHLLTGSDAQTLKLAAALAAESSVVSSSPNWISSASVEETPGSPSPGSTFGVAPAGTQSALERQCSKFTRWLSDPLSACSWHLDAGTNYRGHFRAYDPTIDINIGDAWDLTMGQGIDVAVVDHHWNPSHEDIAPNVNARRSSNWGQVFNEPIEDGSPVSHGTRVAGVIGARDNSLGGRGVAPRVSMRNHNVLDDGAWSFSNWISGFSLDRSSVAVSNHSYGFEGAYPGLLRVSGVWRTTMNQGLTWGFGGKGTLYVQSAGNSKNQTEKADSEITTLHETNNHRGTVVVCAVDAFGNSSWYSNEGANLWVCAPSNGVTGLSIIAPAGANKYTTLGGTSAAAPIVSGVAALVRSVNRDLTWRDVKVLLADTARKQQPTSFAGRLQPFDSSWQAGAAKYSNSSQTYSFSEKFGFGVVDAEAAVEAALTWPLLPALKSSSAAASPNTAIPGTESSIELSLTLASKIDFIEHINVDVNAVTQNFRDFTVTLVSPSGSESQLSRYGPSCAKRTDCGLRGAFRFSTSRHLGESAAGTWKLRIRNHRAKTSSLVNPNPNSVLPLPTTPTSGLLRHWGITVYGHTAAERTTSPSLSLRVGASDSVWESVDEGASVPVTVKLRDGTLTKDLVVPLALTAGTATAPGGTGADYAGLASITIPSGATSATASISITADTADEDDETFTVGFGSPPSGYRVVGVPTTVTIVDSVPQPRVSVAASAPEITEGSSVTFSLTANPAPSAALSVPVTIGHGGTFVPSSQVGKRTVTIPTGGSAQVVVTSVGDTTDEPDGTITLTVGSGQGYAVGSPSSVTVSVADDDDPVVLPEVRITAGPSVVEGSAAVFTVTATPAPATTLAVPVTLTQSGTYAAAGQTNPRTVTVPSSGTATVTVATVDDTVDEPDGSITVTAGQSVQYRLVDAASASVTVADNDDPPPSTPEVTVTGGSAVTEGGTASFTVSASPAPSSPLTVSVTVGQSGDYAASGTTGTKTVTVPTSGSASYSVATVDDSTDEADGSVTLTVGVGSDYTVGSPSAATVYVFDDDNPVTPKTCTTADAALVAQVTAKVARHATETGRSDLHEMFSRSLATMQGSDTYTTSDIKARPDKQGANWQGAGSNPLWRSIYAELDRLENCRAGTLPKPKPAVPTVTVSAGSAVTEGGSATFTVTASPAPASPLSVSLTVAQSGDYTASGATGTKSVTIPTSGSVSYSVATVDDSTDEADGSVTVTVGTGSGYTVGSSSQAAVSVADNDNPPVVLPTVSVSAGSAVTEGGSASFTVTASPAPSQPLSVSLTVSQSGDYAASGATGAKTVTVPTSGSVSYSVATVDDSTDEADGSVSVSVGTGQGYTVGSSSQATVNVSDNDDPPADDPPAKPAAGLQTDTMSVSVSELNLKVGGTATFTVVLRNKPTATVSVVLNAIQVRMSSPDSQYALYRQPFHFTRIWFTPDDWNVPKSVTVHGDRAAERKIFGTVHGLGGNPYLHLPEIPYTVEP